MDDLAGHGPVEQVAGSRRHRGSRLALEDQDLAAGGGGDENADEDED
jgi:hypothetical protein